MTFVSHRLQCANWNKERIGEAGLCMSDVPVVILTPFPPFAHFSDNDLKFLDYFFAFAKHLKIFAIFKTHLDSQISTLLLL